MDSNGAYGQLAHDDELAEVFDQYDALPERGANAALDALLDAKHLDVGALVRVGARLASHDVIAFGFPDGIKFRDLITGRRWSYLGSRWHRLKIVPAGRERSSVVIVAEGESDAARLTMLYPGTDIACLPAGADPRPHAAGYAAQLNEYELVLLGHDPDTAGDNGAALLAEHLTTKAARFTAGDDDWCALNGAEPPALPDPADVEPDTIRVGGLVFEPLGPLLAGDLSPPLTMVDDLLYVEGVHWISGHPGSGKTTLTMHAAWLAMQDGRDVVWLDYEGGPRATVRRLREVGIPDELLLERFHYTSWPHDAAEHFAAVAARWPGAFIVMDSASKALTTAGLDENSPPDVTKWVAPIVKACKEHALPVVVIDHVTKNATNTSRYSRGAGSKLADADVAWYVEVVDEFNRDKAGMIRCKRQKDREGSLPFELYYEVGDGKGGLPITPADAPTEGSDSPEI